MFGKTELEHLRLRKELLVLQCDTRRMLLAAELQGLRSAEFWWAEAASVARRHPLLTASLGVGAGVVAIQALRQPGVIFGWLGRLSGLSSTAWSVWKSFRAGGRQR